MQLSEALVLHKSELERVSNVSSELALTNQQYRQIESQLQKSTLECDQWRKTAETREHDLLAAQTQLRINQESLQVQQYVTGITVGMTHVELHDRVFV
jgi:hypothetical protein